MLAKYKLVLKVVSYDVIMKTRSHRFSYGQTKILPATIDCTNTQT